ncbi:MAG: hypothetical protein M1281_20465 [Chloroflexi bacterium]|nr:hypothetical protein [Chloroflexota bacterium]
MFKYGKGALLVLLLLALAYGYFYEESDANGNSRLALTFAMVKEGRLTIDSYHADKATFLTRDKAFYDGHFYTDKAIGSSVLAAVFFLPINWLLKFLSFSLSLWKLKYLLTFLTIGLPSAFAGSLIYVVCEAISGSKIRSFIVTLAIALGTLSFPFSTLFFSHALAGSLLFIGFFLLFQIRTNPDPAKNAQLLLIGFLLGLALITEFTTAVVVIPLILYYLYIVWVKYRRQAGRPAWIPALMLPALGGLIPLAIMFAYNIQVYGKPLVSGYQYLNDPVFREAMSHGIEGITLPKLSVLYYETIQPAIGLFWQSPVLLMALVGAVFMARVKKYRPELMIAATAFIAYLLLNAGYFMWWGGNSPGPRQIIPMLPFLCLPLIFVPRRLFPLVTILGIVSIFQMLVITASHIMVPEEYLVRIPQYGFFQFSVIYNYCLDLLSKQGVFAWNLGQSLLGLQRWASLLPLILAIAGSAIFMAFYSTRTDRNRKNRLEPLSS